MPRRIPLAVALLLANVVPVVGAAPAMPDRRDLPLQGPTEPTLTVTLYSNTVVYHTVANSVVNGELRDDAGRTAEGIGFSGSDGVAVVTFGLFNPDVVRPGDHLSFTRPGAEPVTFTAPLVAAAAEAATDTVRGIGPASTALEVSLTVGGDAPASVQRSVTTQADGTFTLSVAGAADLQPGLVTGEVRLTTADGDVVVAPFANLNAVATLGAASISGQANPGTTVRVTRTVGGTAQDMGSTTALESGGWAIAFPPGADALTPGDHVAVRQEGGPLAETATVEGDLAALTVTLNQLTDTVSGTAPAGTRLALLADSLDGATARLTATAAADGRYSVAFTGQADLVPGWRVRAAYEPTPALRVSALAVLPAARIGVGIPLGFGRAAPGLTVTVTLTTGTGVVKARTQSVVDDQGEYQLFIGGFGGGPTPQPGDIVELEFVGGDPIPLDVPELSAESDLGGNAVVGRAPAGRPVSVQVDGQPDATVLATVGPGGDYRGAFAGWTLERPANGSVVYTAPDGYQFYTTWAVVQLNASMGSAIQSNFVVGNGPAWSQAHAELRDAQGQLVGQGDSPVFGGLVVLQGVQNQGPPFFIQIRDVTGALVEMQPGDTLHVTAGLEEETLVVPPLDAVVLVTANTLTGVTAPDSDVTILVAQTQPNFDRQFETRSNSTGAFGYDFGTELHLRHGDLIQLGVAVAGHQVLNQVIAPGLLLDMDGGQLLGAIGAAGTVTVHVTRAGKPVAEAHTQTDDTGAFYVQLVDGQGGPLVVAEGDIVEATHDTESVDPLLLTVPRLDVDYNIAADTVRGQATPGGDLTLLATEAYPRDDTLGIAQAWPAVTSQGTFDAHFVPGVNVRPGKRFIALYRPAEGHYAYRQITVPILNAEHAGPNACGFGLPRGSVDLALQDGAGAALAGAMPGTRYDGYFSALARDGAGTLVGSAAGETWQADLGNTTARIALPPFDLQVNWEQGFALGTGPANAAFFLAPAEPCPVQQQPSILNVDIRIGFSQRTGPDGTFTTFVPQFGGPGAGLEVAFYDPNDHRWFRQAFPGSADAYMGTDRVDGQVDALSEVRLDLAHPPGTAEGTATGRADGYGRFTAHLAGAAAAKLDAGDTITLTFGTRQRAATLEPLGFDWSPEARAVTGQAPAGRSVQLLLRLAWGEVLSIPLTADQGGAFSFDTGDVPPRAYWTMADVVAVRVVLPLGNGFREVDQTPGFEGPLPTPGGTIFLPLVNGGTRAGSARAAAVSPVRTAPAPVGRQPVTIGAVLSGLHWQGRVQEAAEGMAFAPLRR